MEWIKFEDQEPEAGQEVIFGKNNMSDHENRLLRPMVAAGHYAGKGKFMSWLTKDFLTATHWMPMPVLKNG